MTFNREETNIGAYADCVDILDRVLASHGGRLRFLRKGQAVNFAQRCYRCRRLLQKASLPKPGTLPSSPYDRIIIKVEPKEGPKDSPADLVFTIREASEELLSSFTPANPPADEPDLLEEALRIKQKIGLF